MQQPLANQSASQPTLLGIPQELRNQIFEHVYQSSSATGQRIDLGCLGICCHKGAKITSSHTPPSKDPMLVCRQLYSEMHGMYIAEYRSFWTTNNFWVSALPHGDIDLEMPVHDRDLQHVRCFVMFLDRGSGDYEVEINLDRGTSSLTGIRCLNGTISPLYLHQLRNFLTDVYNTFIETLCTEVSAQDGSMRATLDASSGQGLTAEELSALIDEFVY